MKTIYIAGRISALPYWWAFILFKLREYYLQIMGYEPINPMTLIPKNIDYDEQVEMGKTLACYCEYIYLSHNWRKSKGAYREYRAYRRSGKNKVLFL